MAALPVLGSIDNSTKYDVEGVSQDGTFDEMAFIRETNDEKAVLLIPAMLYTVILMIIGVIGNPIAIYIYGFRWKKTTLKYFLLSLAVIDLANCLITMPTEIALMRHYYYFNNAVICKVSTFTTFVLNNASSVILLVLAVDRYIRICKPYNKPISVRGSKVACFAAIVFGVCDSWPAIVLYGRMYMPYYLKDRVIQFVKCNVENQFIHTPYPLAFFMYELVGFSLTATVMSVLYILIGRTILMRKKMNENRIPIGSVTTKSTNSHSPTPQVVTDSPTTYPVTENEETPRQSSNSDSRQPKRRWSMFSFSPGNTPVTENEETPRRLSNSDSRQPKRRWSMFSFSPGNTPVTENEETPRRLSISDSRKPKRRWSTFIRPPGKTTRMLFTITLVYIVSFLPYFIVVIIRNQVGPSFYTSLTNGEQVFVNIVTRSYLVNNCANPVVYGMYNTKFRNECKSLFRRITCRKQTIPL